MENASKIPGAGFKSQAQRNYMHSEEPEVARGMESQTPDVNALPPRVKPKANIGKLVRPRRKRLKKPRPTSRNYSDTMKAARAARARNIMEKRRRMKPKFGESVTSLFNKDVAVNMRDRKAREALERVRNTKKVSDLSKNVSRYEKARAKANRAVSRSLGNNPSNKRLARASGYVKDSAKLANQMRDSGIRTKAAAAKVQWETGTSDELRFGKNKKHSIASRDGGRTSESSLKYLRKNYK